MFEPSHAQLAAYTLHGGLLTVLVALLSAVVSGPSTAGILALCADAIVVFVAGGYAVSFDDARFVWVGGLFALWALTSLALAAHSRTFASVFWAHWLSAAWGALVFAAIHGAIVATH